MKHYDQKIKCPCGLTHRIPVLGVMEIKKLEDDYNLAEISAQEKYSNLWLWLHSASLFELIKFWFRKK